MPAGGVPGSTVHASCVVLGEAGILIRGASGAGKSTLARRLIATGEREGRFARLVGDDRVALSAAGGRLLARPSPAARGLIEVRGLGLRRIAHEPACVLRLIVDLVTDTPDRFPDEVELHDELLGIRLPRVVANLPGAADMIAWRFRGPDDTMVTDM